MAISKTLLGLSVLSIGAAASLTAWLLRTHEIAPPSSPEDRCVAEYHRFVTGDLTFSRMQRQQIWNCYEHGRNDDQSAVVFFLEMKEYQCAGKIRARAELRGKPLDPYFTRMIPRPPRAGTIAC
jgi:hypothetical protein